MYQLDYQGEYNEISKEFLRIEHNKDLLSLKIDGIKYWERVRLQVFQRILKRKEVLEKTKVEDDKFLNYLKAGIEWGKSLFRNNPLYESESDILFIGSSRRKLRQDGNYWDIYFDPIIDNLNLNYTYIEPPFRLSHKTPAKTPNINYLDFITYTSVLQRKLGLVKEKIPPAAKKRLKQAEAEIRNNLDVNIDLVGLVKSKVNERRSRKWLYKLMLERINPSIALITVGAFKKTFIESCKEKDIPVAEYQHGGFGPDHLGYSYPKGKTTQAYPDYLFVFGRFWKDSVNFPIPQDHIFPVGYPYLEEEKEKYKIKTDKNKIVFISQYPVGDIISKFAVSFANNHDEYNVILKLHPKEYSSWQNEYPWINNTKLEVVDGDQPPLYKLLSRSNTQVGVNSTVIWEGLNFNMNTILLDAPGVERMEYLIENFETPVVSSTDEMAKVLEGERSSNRINTRYFFEPNPIERFSSAIENVIKS